MKVHVPSISKIVVICCCTDYPLNFSGGALKSFKITALEPRRSPSCSSRMVSRLWRIISQGWFHLSDLTVIHVQEYRSSILQKLWFIASQLVHCLAVGCSNTAFHKLPEDKYRKKTVARKDQKRAQTNETRELFCVFWPFWIRRLRARS